ncbi:MAG TPA: hypothetical protein VN717_02490 [Gemmatimonadaceae bacterium]|nr:hypothetical protein [Gemmatimonadaceae bacterium]
MRHFHRTNLTSDDVLAMADEYFPTLGLTAAPPAARSRTFSGTLGTVTISARPEGGHYVFIEAVTDQAGESRLDRNVKRFFVRVHRTADPAHKLAAAY